MFETTIDPTKFLDVMVTFKHKPTLVKAVQLSMSFKVETLEGIMKGKALDWLVQGTKGEFYVVDKDIFEIIFQYT